jgi:hypothetical protein
MDRSDTLWRIGIIAAAVLTVAAYLVVSTPLQSPSLPGTTAGDASGGRLPRSTTAAPEPRGAARADADLAAPHTVPEAVPARVTMPPTTPAARIDLDVLLDVLEELTVAGGTLPDPVDTLVRRDRDGRLVVAAGTQRRYSPLVEALNAVDPVAVVTELGRLEPSTTTAEHSEGDLESRLHDTIAALLAFDLPDVEPTMVAHGPGWVFAEPEYEALSGAERHLLLMGRRQARAVRSKLEAIRLAFAWPDPPVDRALTMAAARPVPASATAVSGSDPATAIIPALPDPEP